MKKTAIAILALVLVGSLFYALYALSEPTRIDVSSDTTSIPNTTTTKPSTTKPTTTKERTTKQTSTTSQTTKPTTTKPSTTLSREEQNYRNLTMDDKADIVEWIQSAGMEISTDDLWAEIADEYGITEEMVDRINMDPDVAYAIGRRNKARNDVSEAAINYDATLSYGNGTVAIGATNDDLDEFIYNVSNDDESANGTLIYQGRLALVEKGTKVKILDRKLTTTKVRVLEGLFEGFEGWTIMEAVHAK